MTALQLTWQRWQAITHNPRTLIVTCVRCHVGTVNEGNGMRRAGWQETSVGRHRQYRCGACAVAETPAGEAR